MNYDEAVLATQFPIVKYFIYHLVYYRIACKSYQESQLKDEFWTLTIDAHLLRATINWCMVFGKDNESTHWKRLVRHSEAEAYGNPGNDARHTVVFIRAARDRQFRLS